MRLELLGPISFKRNLVAVFFVNEDWQVIALHKFENAVGQLVLSHFTVDLGAEIRFARCYDRVDQFLLLKDGQSSLRLWD